VEKQFKHYSKTFSSDRIMKIVKSLIQITEKQCNYVGTRDISEYGVIIMVKVILLKLPIIFVPLVDK
jgi:hypothetical protein